MPAKSYPFIDIAVHERVRDHFAKGDAAVLFSPDMTEVLWSNGEGAALFGQPSIYDFIDTGANRSDVAFRQLEVAARQLVKSGDRRSFLMRVAAGFQRVPVNGSVEMITVRPGDTAILFTAPFAGKPVSAQARAARMISGFDDPDTHMAVLDGDGSVVAASPGFAALEMTPQTCRMLVTAVGRDSDWLLKRPVATGRGHLPAAIGKLSENPALHLLFAVETILGHLDPGADFEEPEQAAEAEAQPEEPVIAVAAGLPDDIAEDLSSIEEIPTQVDEFIASPELPAEERPDEPLQEAAPQDPAEDPTAADEPEDEPAIDVADEPLVLDAVAQDAPAGSADETEAEPESAPSDEVGVEDEKTEGADQDASPPSPGNSLFEHPRDEHDAPATEEDAEPQAAADIDLPFTEADQPLEEAATVGQEPAAQEIIDPLEHHAFIEDHDAVSEPRSFVFNPASRAIRFVWKIDADGRFREISDEFATAVGPNSAEIGGERFTDLAERYQLDPGNTIGALLKRRDTWSGKTIFWPVEGTRLQVPVDLAALPTYSRNREFDGFRGFGIVRIADVIDDPQAIGLTFGQAALPEESAADPESEAHAEPASSADVTAGDVVTEAQEAAPDPETVPAQEPEQPIEGSQEQFEYPQEPIEDPADELEPPVAESIEDVVDSTAEVQETDAPDTEAPGEDPFRGERPALKLVETPERPASEKIIRLDNHRADAQETLSRSEQAAFREIARQLGETFGKRPNEQVTAQDQPVADTDTDTAVSGSTQPEDLSDVPGEETADEVSVETARLPEETDAAAELPVPAAASRSSSLTPDLLDSLPLALLVHSGDELFHANAEFLELTGYSGLGELQDEGGIDALFAGDEDDLFDLPDGTLMLIRKDGRLIPVKARLQSVRWEDKGALMMALSAADPQTETAPIDLPLVEEVAEPEPGESPMVEALRMETEELRSILETATDGVVVVGSEGEIRSVNRSASALFNYDDNEVRGKPFAMLFAHESQKSVLDYLSGLSGHGVASVLNDGREVIGREASGGFIPLFMTMGRLSSSNGFCAVIRDITQWKRTEEELRNAKRAAETANAHKSDFLARVSHEIRTPLNAIIGFSDMMASEHFGPIGNPRYVEYASDIGRSGRHVLDIVNDLLDISKIEAGEMDLEFTAVEINDAVSEAVSLVQPQANSQRVIIRTSLSGSVPAVVADNRSIKQIALNILANAIRFTPSGGQIVVSTAYEANGSVILRIRDTGVGMTRTELEQAMKPFRQVSTGARKRGEGTGLGLPLTKAMAEANRANFSINSAPNEGTLVEISFPSQRVLAN